MKIQDIRVIVKAKNAHVVGKKKVDLVRAIQQVEGNEQCFDTGKSSRCLQSECLWREDCDN